MTRSAFTWALVVAAASGLDSLCPGVRQQAVRLAPALDTVSYRFRQIVGLRELPSGDVIVSDKVANALTITRAGGAVTEVIAQGGTGPLRFSVAGPLFSLGGDSTLIADYGTGRWLVLRGRAIASLTPVDANVATIPIPLGTDTLGRVLTVRSGSDSLELVLRTFRTGESTAVGRLRAPAVGRVVDSLEMSRVVRLHLSVNAHGDQATLFPDGWIAIARIEPYRIEWRAPDGHLAVGPSMATGEKAGAQPPFSPVSPVLLSLLNPALFTASDGALVVARHLPGRSNPRYDVVRRGHAFPQVLDLDARQIIVGFGRASVYVATNDNGHQTLSRHAWPP